MMFSIFCVYFLHQRSAESDWTVGAHEGVEACDLTVRSERTGVDLLSFEVTIVQRGRSAASLLYNIGRLQKE